MQKIYCFFKSLLFELPSDYLGLISDDEQREAIQSLMDAGEHDRAAKLANEAITQAVARYPHDAMLEREGRQAGNEPR